MTEQMKHPETTRRKLVVTLSRGVNDDKSTVAFTVANAARSQGLEVGVFLSSDGVELSRDGGYDLTHVKPFKELDELVTGFLGAGGVVWACSPCCQHRGLPLDETLDGVVVTGAGPMLEWIADGAQSLSF